MVSRLLGKLDASRHLSSGWAWAMAGAGRLAASAPAPATPAPAMNRRRPTLFMVFPSLASVFWLWSLVVVGQPLPALRSIAFERLEAALVGHLAAAGDPVAEIGVGQPAARRLADQPQDEVAAEAAARLLDVVEAVDRGDPVARPVDQAATDQPAAAVAQLDQVGVQRAVLDHRDIFMPAHADHLAILVAAAEIAGEERELLGRSPGQPECCR